MAQRACRVASATWRAYRQNVNKILGVIVVGGVLLGAFLYGTRDKRADVRADPAAVASTPVAVALNTMSTTVASPAPAAPTVAPVPVATAGSTTSDTTACARLSDLCSTSDEKVDPPACMKQLADARKMAGPANVERSELCLADAKTCAAATGCISGGVGMGAMGEYLKGLGGALSR